MKKCGVLNTLFLLLPSCLLAESPFFEHLKVAFNQQPSHFGKTHFIIGYDGTHEPSKTATVQKTETPGTFDVPDVFFTPDNNVRQALIYFIQQEQERIQVAMFVFTEKNIADALIDAHKRGVEVEIVTDSACLRDRNNKIGLLCQHGVKVYIYDASMIKGALSSCLHHKFVTFKRSFNNKELVWTGSYNFTRAASETNQENALILEDPAIVNKFMCQFSRLKQRAYRYGNGA